MTSRVLIVDDDEEFRTLLADTINGAGLRTYTAATGLEALNTARTVLPDLILLDVDLPDMDGMTVCEILRKQPSTADALIVIVTGFSTKHHCFRAGQAGADHFISKPLRLRNLKECLHEMLQQRQAKLEVLHAFSGDR